MKALLAQLATDIAQAQALEARLHTTRNLASKRDVPHPRVLFLTDAISLTNTIIHKLKVLQRDLEHVVAAFNL